MVGGGAGGGGVGLYGAIDYSGSSVGQSIAGAGNPYGASGGSYGGGGGGSGYNNTDGVSHGGGSGGGGALRIVHGYQRSFPNNNLGFGQSGGYTAFFTPEGQRNFTAAGTYTWQVPAGVNSISVGVIGSGGGGSAPGAGGASYVGPTGGGGGYSYQNNIAVTPGQNFTVVVGQQGSNGYSQYYTYQGDGTNGEASSFSGNGVNIVAGGGGGAASGGYPGSTVSPTGGSGTYLQGNPGRNYSTHTVDTPIHGGAGQYLYFANGERTYYGAGGSRNGGTGVWTDGPVDEPPTLGIVRIIWSGSTSTARAFPSTNVYNL
jgi:hypothetical protein